KSAREVKAEIPVDVGPTIRSAPRLKQKIVTKSAGKTLKTLVNPSEKQQTRKINGKELIFTNLDKLYWPVDKIQKRDVINYYYQAAQYILPYMKDRPQSLNRHPNGITG